MLGRIIMLIHQVERVVTGGWGTPQQQGLHLPKVRANEGDPKGDQGTDNLYNMWQRLGLGLCGMQDRLAIFRGEMVQPVHTKGALDGYIGYHTN